MSNPNPKNKLQKGDKIALKPAALRASANVHFKVTSAQKAALTSAAKERGQTLKAYLLEGKL